MDLNKDRFLNEEEFKKAAEAEQAKIRAIVQTMMPAQQPRPAPAQARPPGPCPRPNRKDSLPACPRAHVRIEGARTTSGGRLPVLFR